ncbi:hypothetical protein X772_30450 [Mesorhizobium sp. LSJC280B00]|nr:hypothetical protein X772_30450 [Mesorhizobium sp. LSJC280B00]
MGDKDFRDVGDGPSGNVFVAYFRLAGAAPPAGDLSRIGTRRGTLFDGFVNHQRCKKSAAAAASFFLPVTYGEKCPAGQ